MTGFATLGFGGEPRHVQNAGALGRRGPSSEALRREMPLGAPGVLPHAFRRLCFVCFLRGDPEDPHRPLVVSGRHAAGLRHHQ